MDPNANFRETCEILAQKFIESDDADRGLELCEALAGWLQGGGFMPAAAESAGLTRDALARTVRGWELYFRDIGGILK